MVEHTRSERAHLVPRMPTACATCGALAEAAMRVQMKTPLQRAKLMQGTIRCSQEKRSGLWQSPHNLLPLSQQGNFFDNLPCMMVIPCVDLPFVHNWTPRQPHDCVVIAGGANVGSEGDAKLIDSCRTLLARTRPSAICIATKQKQLTRQICIVRSSALRHVALGMNKVSNFLIK